MNLEEFLGQVKQGNQVSFTETQSIIKRYYKYTPASFSNGRDNDQIKNEAEQNEGSHAESFISRPCISLTRHRPWVCLVTIIGETSLTTLME